MKIDGYSEMGIYSKFTNNILSLTAFQAFKIYISTDKTIL